MTTPTPIASPRHRLRSHQDPPAGRLGLRRLRRRRHHPADRRRDAVRGGRPARRRARARRRRRQRQRHAGRGAPLLRRGRRPTTCRALLERAASAPPPKGWRSTSARPTPSSCRSRTASFDVVLSIFGVMFTPDQAQAAAELARVTARRAADRPGQLDAGRLHRPAVQDHRQATSRRPPGLKSPALWGTEAHLRELFGPAIGELRAERRQFMFRYRSADALHRRVPHLLRAGAQGVRRARRPSKQARWPTTICASCSAHSTRAATTRWSCRATTSRR